MVKILAGQPPGKGSRGAWFPGISTGTPFLIPFFAAGRQKGHSVME
jgi:hypothetical protein